MFYSVKGWVRRRLLRSQAYTGTDNIYIAKHGFWTSGGFFFNSVIGLLTVVAYANLAPQETYGTYKYLLSLIGMLGFLTLSGANSAVAQSVASGHKGALRYGVRLQLKWNLIYIATGIGMAGWYAWHGNWVFAASLGMLAIAAPLTSAFNTYGPYLTGTKQFRRSVTYAAIATLLAGSCNLAAVLLSDSVMVWIGAYAVGTLLPCAFFYRTIARALPAEPTPEEKTSLVRYLGHLSFVNILSMVGQYLDKVLTFQYVGPAALATYAFATLGPDRAKGWLKSFGTIAMLKLAERSLAEIDRVFYRRTLQSMAIGFAAAGIYSVAAPIVFTLLFPKYLSSIPYSQVLSLSLAGVMAGTYMGQVFASQRMLRVIYPSSLGAHGLRITLFITLGYWYGIWGMIAAHLATQFAGILWNCILWELAMRREGLRQR
jgi:O-antigen/teichoic acid export membrane protein